MAKKQNHSQSELSLSNPNYMNKVYLDLGCGLRKRKGYIGVDTRKLDGVDIVCDVGDGLLFREDSIDGIYSNFLFERIRDTSWLFKEIYRVCNNRAVILFSVPYYQSVTQYKDPTHKAIIVPEMIRFFTDDKWYGSDYGFEVKFRLARLDYVYLLPYGKLKSRRIFFLWPITLPLLKFFRRSLWNVIHSSWITLEVIK